MENSVRQRRLRSYLSAMLLGLSSALPAAADPPRSGPPQPGSSAPDLSAPGPSSPAPARYPTADEVYYVIACMDMNGHNAEGLRKCSCAINALEARLPFQDYSDAELVMATRQAGGRNAAIFRDAPSMKAIMNRFVEAQSAANAQCFKETNHAANESQPGKDSPAAPGSR
jgi:hypothetical protein